MLVHNAKVKIAPFSSKGFGVWALGFGVLGFWVLGFGVHNRLEKGANLTPAVHNRINVSYHDKIINHKYMLMILDKVWVACLAPRIKITAHTN